MRLGGDVARRRWRRGDPPATASDRPRQACGRFSARLANRLSQAGPLAGQSARVPAPAGGHSPAPCGAVPHGSMTGGLHSSDLRRPPSSRNRGRRAPASLASRSFRRLSSRVDRWQRGGLRLEPRRPAVGGHARAGACLGLGPRGSRRRDGSHAGCRPARDQPYRTPPTRSCRPKTSPGRSGCCRSLRRERGIRDKETGSGE